MVNMIHLKVGVYLSIGMQLDVYTEIGIKLFKAIEFLYLE